MTNAFLKPAKIKDAATGESTSAIVRDPDTMEPLKAEGEWKAITPFWTRRIRDRDVIDATPKPSAAKSPK